MSFDLFLCRFRKGETEGIPLDQIRRAFGQHLTETEPDVWTVRYDAENWSTLYVGPLPADPGVTDELCINRPSADPRLWNAVWELLHLERVVVFYPGDGPSLVASPLTVSHLPLDFSEGAGAPVVVHSAEDIVRHIVEG